MGPVGTMGVFGVAMALAADVVFDESTGDAAHRRSPISRRVRGADGLAPPGPGGGPGPGHRSPVGPLAQGRPMSSVSYQPPLGESEDEVAELREIIGLVPGRPVLTLWLQEYDHDRVLGTEGELFVYLEFDAACRSTVLPERHVVDDEVFEIDFDTVVGVVRDWATMAIAHTFIEDLNMLWDLAGQVGVDRSAMRTGRVLGHLMDELTFTASVDPDPHLAPAAHRELRAILAGVRSNVRLVDR